MNKFDRNKRGAPEGSDVVSRTCRHRKNTHSQIRRRAKKQIYLILFAAALVLLVILLLVSRTTDELKGQWRIDEITAYRFDGDGNGFLVLPDQEFDFQYMVQEDQLHIDFTDENVRDFTYTFEILEDKLILSGGEGKEQAEYILTRE